MDVKIVVCIKRVPDTGARIRIGPGSDAIDAEGLRYVLNPYDEFALEGALRAGEAADSGEIVLLTLGDSSAEETLRSGLAMGADRAILLEGESTWDGLSTAKRLATAVEEEDPNLVLLGRKAVDDDQEQVGPMVATLLGWSCVSAVSEFEVENGHVRCACAVDGGVQRLRVPLPAVLTVTKGAYEPRIASMKGIMAAKRKPLERLGSDAVPSSVTLRSLDLPPERTAGEVLDGGPDAVPELARILRKEGLI